MVAFPAVADLHHTEALHATLVAGQALPSIVDVHDVQRFSTASVQLLLALARESAKRGEPCDIDAAQPALQEALAALGVPSSLLHVTHT